MLMEPLTESLPQAIVQTTCYIVGRQAGIVILTDIYLFSSILGAISISKSMLIIAWRVFWAGSWTDVSWAASCCRVQSGCDNERFTYRCAHAGTALQVFLLAARTEAWPTAP